MPTKRSGSSSTTDNTSTPKKTRAPRATQGAKKTASPGARKAASKTTTAPKTVRRPRTRAQAVKSEAERRNDIAVAAYYRAEARGFQPGFEIDDWLAAERSIDQALGQRRSA